MQSVHLAREVCYDSDSESATDSQYLGEMFSAVFN